MRFQQLLVAGSAFYSTPISFGAALTAASQSPHKRIAVLGGGASGIFASIACAEASAALRVKTTVTVFEATSKTLTKVKISGGGRCNVMHDTSKPIERLLQGYPRGNKELSGMYHKRFTPSQARQWFQDHGVTLKTEADGRMFPTSDSSQTIIDALLDAAGRAGVQVCTQQKVVGVQTSAASKNFNISFKDSSAQEPYDAVIVATGSAVGGYQIAEQLGHDIVTPVPSLFTLNCKHDIKQEGELLHGLQGLSVPHARVSLSKKQWQEGPLLITHHGISGPAVLKLSAFAARDFKERNYRCPITINWDVQNFGTNIESMVDILSQIGSIKPKRKVANVCPLRDNTIPKRLWASLCHVSGFGDDDVWGSAKKTSIRRLATNLLACPIETTGKGTFKEEFVTAGGVDLKQIDMKTMSSKLRPGLFFCGEVINIDGITGGYNFLNCWSTGHVAGVAASQFVARNSSEQ